MNKKPLTKTQGLLRGGGVPPTAPTPPPPPPTTGPRAARRGACRFALPHCRAQLAIDLSTYDIRIPSDWVDADADEDGDDLQVLPRLPPRYWGAPYPWGGPACSSRGWPGKAGSPADQGEDKGRERERERERVCVCFSVSNFFSAPRLMTLLMLA